MIELPEAVAMARQLDGELRGKRIVKATCGNTPHKWVFYRPSREVVIDKAPKHVVRQVTAHGSGVRLHLKPSAILVIEGFGGRLLLHDAGQALPKKHHLLLVFDDDAFLTLAVQGWGFVRWGAPRGPRGTAVSPIAKEFTQARLNRLLADYEKPDKGSIKLFFTNGNSIAGIGNGYLQDILFRARIHPRRKIADITAPERKALYRAIKTTMKQAIALDGRRVEKDIHGQPGRYKPLMDQFAKGKPCPECGTTIEKMNYLGGSCYVCPRCQT